GYDPIRDETVIADDNPAYPVAVWNGFNWTLRQPLVSPTFNSGYERAMALDPVDGRLVLTGFSNSSQPVYWEWTGISWNQRLPSFTTALPNTPLFGAMAT